VPIKEQTKGGDKQSTSNLLVSEKTEIFGKYFLNQLLLVNI
jgi:hypothetical protein